MPSPYAWHADDVAAQPDLFSGPVEVMLTRAQDVVPIASARPGGTIWEPKWDGYRSILQASQGGVRLWSRNGTNLSAAFPDVVDAAKTQVPDGVVLDGETVAFVDGRLSF